MAKKYETMEATELRLSILKYKKKLKPIKNIGLYVFTTKENIFIKLVDLDKSYQSSTHILVEIRATDFNIKTSNNTILALIAAPSIKIELQSVSRLKILLLSVIKQNTDNTLENAKSFLEKLVNMPTFNAAYNPETDYTKFSTELRDATMSRMTIEIYNTVFENDVDLSDSLQKALIHEESVIDKLYHFKKPHNVSDALDYENSMTQLKNTILRKLGKSLWV